MSMTFKKQKVKITDVVVALEKNVRLAVNFEVAGQKVDTYDLPDMIDQIIAGKGIRTPLVLNGNLEVLQGFRRALAGQAIMLDPARYVSDEKQRKELVEALNSVDVIVYPNLTADEELVLINDHGDRKGIGRTELVRIVWRLYEQGYNGGRISNLQHYALAEYTGNVKKLNELANMSVSDRNERIKRWFHGTVDNFLIAAYNMGPRIRDALLITEMRTDGLIKKDSDVKPLFVVKRDRIVQLSKAKTQDEEAGKWDNAAKTGPAFEELVQKFITEDETGKTTPADTRLSKANLEERATSAFSNSFRAAFSIAAGKPSPEAPDLDRLAADAEAKFNLINKHYNQIANPTVKDVLGRVVHAAPNDFEQFLLQMCEAVPERTVETAEVS
jgi:hypothetical protein